MDPPSGPSETAEARLVQPAEAPDADVAAAPDASPSPCLASQWGRRSGSASSSAPSSNWSLAAPLPMSNPAPSPSGPE